MRLTYPSWEEIFFNSLVFPSVRFWWKKTYSCFDRRRILDRDRLFHQFSFLRFRNHKFLERNEFTIDCRYLLQHCKKIYISL